MCSLNKQNANCKDLYRLLQNSMTKMICCNATSCPLSASFDFFVSPFCDKPAGSSKAKLFPFGGFLHVIPFWGVCICQRYTQLGLVQMATDLQPSRLAFCSLDILWLSQCRA